ncbi:hypothetical protein [Streptomyces sp. NPDC001070]
MVGGDCASPRAPIRIVMDIAGPGVESHMNAVPGHVRFVVQPVLREDLTRCNAYGPVLQLAMPDAGVVPSREAVEDARGRLRRALAAGR